MDDKKNLIIAALVALLLISAIWGQKEAGRRKEFARENAKLHVQLKETDEEAKKGGEAQAEAARQKEVRQQKEAQLDKARQKIEELQGKLSRLTELEKALAVAEEAKNALAGESGEKMKAQQEQLAQQKAALAAQEQKLAAAAKAVAEEQKLVNECEEQLKGCEQVQVGMDELEAANKQIEEERNKVLTEAETLRAQVIGLEKIVEERSAALDTAAKELENCKINNSVLINQIAQQSKLEPKKSALKNKAEQQQVASIPVQQAPTPEQKPAPQPVQQK